MLQEPAHPVPVVYRPVNRSLGHTVTDPVQFPYLALQLPV